MIILQFLVGVLLGINIVLALALYWALTDNVFGLWSRKAFEIAHFFIKNSTSIHVGFMDLDRLHDLNDTLGYEAVNASIRVSFNNASKANLRFPVKFRSRGLFRRDWIFRYFSGDEIVFLAREKNINGMANRILRELKENKMSATIVTAPITQLEEAKEMLEMLKRNDHRGLIAQIQRHSTTIPVAIPDQQKV